jgi:chemotaxis protein CheC
MKNQQLLSEEQVDFLREMMNIGAGNAATALGQMLRCEVNVRIPTVHVLPAPEAPSVLGDPSLPVAGVRMGLVGDVVGELFFIVPADQRADLTHLAERAIGFRNSEFGMRNDEPPQSAIRIPHSEDLSALTEIGNILAGVYLTAIHEFCKLHIYHTVPIIAIDMIQSLLDESIVALSRQVQALILIENEFTVEERRIRTFLLVIPAVQSVRTLVDSVEGARMAYGSE